MASLSEDQRNAETRAPLPGIGEFPQEKAGKIVDRAIEQRLGLEHPESLEQQLEFREINEVIDAERDEMRRLMPFELKKELPLANHLVHMDDQGVLLEIGKYIVKRKLGHGAFGDAYEAQDYQLRRKVVVKFINAEATQDPEHVTRFFKEIQIAANMSSEMHQIVAPLDAGKFIHPKTGQETYFYVMEECDGGDLYRAKESISASTESEKLKIIEKNVPGLIEALERIHKAGFMHADIKPKNILISAGQWKIGDFGLADAFAPKNEQEEKGYFFGTPVYLAPEYVAGEGRSSETDLYALAVSLFETFTNTMFFSEDVRPIEILRNLIHTYEEGEFSNDRKESLLKELKRNLSSEVGKVLYQMLQPDPKKRIPLHRAASVLRSAIQADKEDQRAISSNETQRSKIPTAVETKKRS